MPVKELRWGLFKKKQAQSDRLPTTQAALHQAILATITAALWMVEGPRRMGTCYDNLPPAPEAILQLVQCGCSKERCSTNRCQCHKAGLNCTDLCNCSDNGETCDNDVQKEDVL
ncbi:unnamed protein product [Porites evermanni]|uniref:CRC domain-containing protein n=1 Tax=Porites evermanni TaxID=104178 RepID=A0ABN8PD97_9CNID|nr:unnamed protein product [Porites evermanni]